MKAKTKLEQVLESDPRYQRECARNVPDIQSVLDVIAEDVCAMLTPWNILAHTKAVYSETVHEYGALSDHHVIIPPLLDFMGLPELPHGSHILDLGCGSVARDTLFLSNMSAPFRAVFMDKKISLGRIPPGRAYRVTAVDGSRAMINVAKFNFFAAIKILSLKSDLRFTPEFVLADMHDLSFVPGVYDGVWSCTALFTHTPRALVRRALCSVASLLRKNGVFGVSYPCGKEGMSYDSLLLSQTGRIKYFSRPMPAYIAREARYAGLKLMRQMPGDLVRNREVKKDFFITQFFRKE